MQIVSATHRDLCACFKQDIQKAKHTHISKWMANNNLNQKPPGIFMYVEVQNILRSGTLYVYKYT